MQQLARLATDIGPAIKPVGHEELLRSIATAARHLFSAASCSIALLDETGRELEFHVASGAGTDDITGMRVPTTVGIAGHVVTTGEYLSIQDVGKDPRFARDVALKTGYVPRSILAVPLKTERGTLGVIEVLDRQSGDRDDRRDLELFSVFAEQAAMAIEHAQIFSALGRELLRALAAAAEGAELREALQEAALRSSGTDSELAALCVTFKELGRADPGTRDLATRVLNAFLEHVRERVDGGPAA